MSTTSVNTYIEALGLTVEELYALSEAERQSLYASFYEEYGTASEQYQALLDSIDYLDEELGVLIDEMDAIIDDANASVEDSSRAEHTVSELEEMLAVVESFSSDFGEAKTDVAEHNVDLTDGSSKTITPGNDVSAGEEFVIDASSTEVEDSTQAPDPHAADDGFWVDTDGDHYTDTLADEDEDGVADFDTNNDGKIDETDMLNSGASTTAQTVTLQLDDGETVALATYDADTGDTRWKITTEDGVIYYITVKGAPDIRFNGNYTINTTGIDLAWAPELLHRSFESSTITKSFGDILGVENPDATAETYYTIYNMDDDADNEIKIDPTTEDFANGRAYTVNCESGITDEINLDLDRYSDAEISFSENSDGDLVITVTTSYGEITITVTGLESSIYTGRTDYINITGGEIKWSTFDAIKDIIIPYEYASGTGGIASLYAMLTHDGKTLEEEGAEEGYDIGDDLSEYLALLNSTAP